MAIIYHAYQYHAGRTLITGALGPSALLGSIRSALLGGILTRRTLISPAPGPASALSCGIISCRYIDDARSVIRATGASGGGEPTFQ